MKGVSRLNIFPGILLVGLLWAGHAQGGPPLLTDDPDTPGPNHWEINVATMSEYIDGAWLLATPLLDMNYGVGEHIQLKYQVQYNELVPAQNGGVEAGMGNTLAGVKWRFIDQTNGAWAEVSMYPQVEFIYPESSPRRGLADRGDNILLPIEVERIWKHLTVYSELGYLHNQYKPSGGWCGLAGEYELTEKFSLMGEFYGGFQQNFQQPWLVMNLGFKRDLIEHVALIGSAGPGLFGPQERAPAFQSYLALQLTF
jgi:hypothetical protein